MESTESFSKDRLWLHQASLPVPRDFGYEVSFNKPVFSAFLWDFPSVT